MWARVIGDEIGEHPVDVAAGQRRGLRAAARVRSSAGRRRRSCRAPRVSRPAAALRARTRRSAYRSGRARCRPGCRRGRKRRSERACFSAILGRAETRLKRRGANRGRSWTLKRRNVKPRPSRSNGCGRACGSASAPARPPSISSSCWPSACAAASTSSACRPRRRRAPTRERLGVPLTTLDETPELDMTVDGADEIGPDLTLIKGGGGALLREKIVAAASARMVVIADESKWVADARPLSAAGRGHAVRAGGDPARDRGRGRRGRLPGPDRAAAGQGRPCFRHGRRALDTRCLAASASPMPESLAGRLSAIPGVVEHGLFIGLAQAVILAGPAGARVVERS